MVLLGSEADIVTLSLRHEYQADVALLYLICKRYYVNGLLGNLLCSKATFTGYNYKGLLTQG